MKLGVRGLAFNTPTPVVRRAMFWGSRQLLELISHSWREIFFGREGPLFQVPLGSMS